MTRHKLAAIMFVLTACVARADAQSDRSLVRLTANLVALSMEYDGADEPNRQRLRARLADAASERLRIVADLMERDPDQVIKAFVPKRHRDRLPPSIRVSVEQETETEGTLEILHEDRRDGTSALHHTLTVADGRRLSMHFSKMPLHVQHGQRVHVRGVELNGLLALGGMSTDVQPLTTVQPRTFGEQRTLGILVNFSDNASQPYSLIEAKASLESTSTFFRSSSFQQTWLSIEVVGWFTLPMSNAATCDFTAISARGQAAANAAGVNVSTYARLVFFFPQSLSCQWWGLSTVGGGTPSLSWINGSLGYVTNHELGHALGLQHAHSLKCGLAVLGSSCTIVDYGDYYDTMGSASGEDFGAFSKEILGWLNYGSSPSITLVQASGTYHLDPYTAPTASRRAIKIPRGSSGSYYYLEYRTDARFFGVTPGDGNGLIVRIGNPTDTGSGWLLDMSAATTPTASADFPLVAGQRFVDDVFGVSMTTLAVSPAGVGVAITVGTAPPPCTLNVPGVSLAATPSTVVPGATTTVAITVTNTNSAACGLSGYWLTTASVPTSWTWSQATSGPSGFAPIYVAPGASAVVMSVTVSVPLSTVAGSYPISLAMRQSDAPNVGTGTLALTVEGFQPPVVPCVHAAPSVTLSLDPQIGVPGSTMRAVVAVTNRDTPSCAASVFVVSDFAVPPVWTWSLFMPPSGVVVHTRSGETAQITLTVPIPIGAKPGLASIAAIVRQDDDADHEMSATVSVLVVR